MRRILAAAVSLLAAAAQAQSVNIQVDESDTSAQTQVQAGDGQAAEVNIQVPGFGVKMQTGANVQVRSNRVEQQSDNSFKARWETEPAGKTLLKVLAPEGAHVEVWDGNRQVVNEDIPVSANARPDTFYRFIIRWPDGAYFEKKLSSKAGMVLSLWVADPNVAAPPPPPPPPPPVVVIERPAPPPPPPARLCMPGGDFGSLKSAIQKEGFGDDKLGVLSTAAPRAWFCADQVGELVDLFSFGEEKLQALRLVKDRIVDRNNNFKILGHFNFSDEKEQAQAMLSE
jgi:hypothetical protein